VTTRYYLVIDGIAGDAVDPTNHVTGAFQVDSFSWGTGNGGSVQTGALPTAFSPLSLTLTTDALAGLLAGSANSTTIDHVSLVGVTTTSQGSAITYSLNLGNVDLSEVNDSNGSVSLSLTYSQIGLVTRGIDANGALEPPESFGWDITQNTSAGPGTTLTSPGSSPTGWNLTENASLAPNTTPSGWDLTENTGTGAGPTSDSSSAAPTVPTTYYLLIDGLNGGSTDKAHAGWFAINNPSIDLGSSDAFSDLSVDLKGATGLADFLADEARGTTLTGVRVEGVDANGESVYDLNLADVHVDAVQVGGAGAGAALTLSFGYDKVSVVTSGQDNTGQLVQTGSFGWDLNTNKSIDPSTMPALTVGTSHGAVAPTQYFLVIHGIAGDYVDPTKQLVGAFKVSSFSFGTAGTPAPSFGSLQVQLTGGSPAELLAASASGELIDHVSLIGMTTIDGKTSRITYSLNLGSAIVSTVSDGGSNSGSAISLALDYDQIGLVTTGLTSAGSALAPESFGWDVANHKAIGSGTTLTSAGSSSIAATVPTAYYLLVDGVNGGSTDSSHAGWFALRNFSINEDNPSIPGTGPFGGQPASFSDLSVAFGSETGLTALLDDEAGQTALKGLRIEGVDANGQAVYDLNLAQVSVTGVDDAASSGFGVSFGYQDISLVTQGQDNSGQLVQTGSFGWDTLTNKPFDPANMPALDPGADHGTVAPTQYFLVIDGIAGDGVDPSNHLIGAFKVDSFGLQTLQQALSGGAATFDPLTVTVASNSAAGLLTALTNGTTIDHVSLIGLSSSSITYSVNLSNVTIGGVSEEGPETSLQLDYGKIGLVTRGADSGGSLQAPQSFGWDVTDDKAAGGGTILTSAGSSVAPSKPTSYFLLVDGINGGSTNASHEDWFALNDFQFGFADGTQGAGAPVVSEVVLSTTGDTGLTDLLAQEAPGTHLKGVRIEGVDANGHAVYDLNLADVLVTGLTDSNSPGLNVTLNFRDISLVTRGEDNSGKLLQTGSFGWDLVKNQAFDPADMPDISPCYCPGTLILTDRGEVPVEDLVIGDSVMTMSGAARPIKWIGWRGYAGRFMQGQKDILPICVKAGAIDDNVPRRDLWISPHHAMYLDGVLIEAIDLVNGVTIAQAEEIERVEYFHIELESHDVLIAEGSLSESYVDDDNRGMFHNAHEYASLCSDQASGPARYCAPRCNEGYHVEAVRRQLALRAGLRAAEEDSGELRGYIDEIGFDRIAGWAQNVDHPEAPVCLDICVGGALIGQALANRYRSDLERAGFGSGCHGFEFVLPGGLDLAKVEVCRSLDHAVLTLSQADIRAAAA